MGKTYVTTTHTTKNDIDLGVETNINLNEGLKALAKQGTQNAAIYADRVDSLEDSLITVYADSTLRKAQMFNTFFDFAKLLALFFGFVYLFRFYQNKRGKNNG